MVGGTFMTDLQFTVAAVLAPSTTIAVVILAALLNNSRLNDVKEVLRAEFRLEIQRLEAKMDEHLRVMLGKIEELERSR
jgi:low affinity Fe/Cu permease